MYHITECFPAVFCSNNYYQQQCRRQKYKDKSRRTNKRNQRKSKKKLSLFKGDLYNSSGEVKSTSQKVSFGMNGIIETCYYIANAYS